MFNLLIYLQLASRLVIQKPFTSLPFFTVCTESQIKALPILRGLPTFCLTDTKSSDTGNTFSDTVSETYTFTDTGTTTSSK